MGRMSMSPNLNLNHRFIVDRHDGVTNDSSLWVIDISFSTYNWAVHFLIRRLHPGQVGPAVLTCVMVISAWQHGTGAIWWKRWDIIQLYDTYFLLFSIHNIHHSIPPSWWARGPPSLFISNIPEHNYGCLLGYIAWNYQYTRPRTSLFAHDEVYFDRPETLELGTTLG